MEEKALEHRSGPGSHREVGLIGTGVETFCIEVGLRQLRKCVSLRDCV